MNRRLHRSLDVALFLSVMALASFATASASAQRAVAFISGATTGPIAGGSVVPGYEGWHDVTLMRQEVTSPRDAGSGLPTGRRTHAPLRLRLPEAVGSVLLHDLQRRNEVTTVQVVMLGADGTTEYTIDLTGARVSQVRVAWNATDGVVYEVEFSYTRITWTHDPGGTTATDDWTTTSS